MTVPCKNLRLFRHIFDHIAVFEALYCWTSDKGGAHMCFVDAWISNKSVKAYEPCPQQKFSDTSLWTQQSHQNSWRNNLRFLHRTATYMEGTVLKCSCLCITGSHCVWPLPPWQPDTSWPNIVTCNCIRTFFHGQCLHCTETSTHYQPNDASLCTIIGLLIIAHHG